MAAVMPSAFRAQSHAWFAAAPDRVAKRLAWGKLGKLLPGAMRRMPQTETKAQKDRLDRSRDRLARLHAQVASWQADLDDGAIDSVRDELLEKIDRILAPRSPAVRAQMAIVRAVTLARAREEKPEGRLAFARTWVASYEPAALEGVDDTAIARAIAGTPTTPENLEHAIANGTCTRCKTRKVVGKCRRAWPDGVKAETMAILELLDAAGVPLGGKSPASTIDKYAHPR